MCSSASHCLILVFKSGMSNSAVGMKNTMLRGNNLGNCWLRRGHLITVSLWQCTLMCARLTKLFIGSIGHLQVMSFLCE